MNQTAAIVVTHNSAEVVGRCLESCRRAGAAEVVVVDNASEDSTAAAARSAPNVRLIANPENRGFAAAVNQGVQATIAPFVLLLNPDAELLDGLAELERACAEPGVAAAAGILVDGDGKPQKGFSVRRLPTATALAFEVLGLNRLWPSNPVNRRYRCLDLDLGREQDVEQPAGAFLLFRRNAWRELGGFDEGFHPIWFEDVDFCRRLAAAGRRVRFVPAVRARHRGGHSVQAKSHQDRIEWWYRSLLEYASRHLGAISRRMVCGAILAGAVPRMVAGIFSQPRSGGTIRAYGKVISLALACLWSGHASPRASEKKSGERVKATADSIQ